MVANFLLLRGISAPQYFTLKRNGNNSLISGFSGGATGRGWGEGRGKRSGGEGGGQGRSKIKEQRPWEGRGGEDGGQAAEKERRVRKKLRGSVRLCVCVCVQVSLSVSLRHVGTTRGYIMCVLDPWVAGGGWGEGRREREEEGGRATPSPAPGWLNSIGPSGRGPGGACRSRV